MSSYQVNFQPVGRRGECAANESLLHCAHELGVGIVSICGGEGLFHCCEIQILSGSVSEPTPVEREYFSPQALDEGYRLACQTYPTSDLKVHVPRGSLTAAQRMQVEGKEVPVRAQPLVYAYQVQVPAASLEDLRADDERLLQELEQQHQVHCDAIDIETLRDLSPRLRSWEWEARVSVRDEEVVALGPWPSRQLGLAVDLGTTKIAGYLIDLDSGETLAAKGVMNPQISYGEDVISRITRAKREPAEAERLQEAAVEAINQLADDLCVEADAEREEMVEGVVVGNTAMHHLLLGLPVDQLAIAPYVPATKAALDIKARDVGLRIAPGAYVHLLPIIAGFVGADHVAMLLATEAGKAEGITLALDIGTNTEVCLARDGTMTSVSCASGPAFEGAHIKHGMRAAEGAIEYLRLADEAVEYQTVGGAPPVGLCGSGILDALAQLYLADLVDAGGRMVADHPRVRDEEGERQFVLVSEEERDGDPAITITQRDVRELQLAKGAIRAGIQVLLETAGVSEGDIDRVIIAGAFGTYIDVSSAVNIGMVPPLPVDCFHQAGNAAGMGAKLALVSRTKRAGARAIGDRVSYIELTNAPRFTSSFVEASYLGLYTLENGKRQEI